MLHSKIGLNADKTHVAVSTDTGIVSVVDLSTKEVSKMKTGHGNVCGCIKFIPTKPKELVSGGYDQKLLHFDYTNGNLLSEREIAPYAPVGGISLSPPFIVSMAISLTGVLAAGTADGRILINFAGERSKEEKKSRKFWNGLDESKEHIIKIAEGPIVAMAFINARALVASSLMGVTILYRLDLEKENELKLMKLWERNVAESIKVNVLITDEKRVVTGGLQPDGTGIIEIWQKEQSS